MEINILKIGDVEALNNHPDSPYEKQREEGQDVYNYDEICKYCLTKFAQKSLKKDPNRSRKIVTHYRNCNVVQDFLIKDAVFWRIG